MADPVRVLVVDDDGRVRRFIRECLEHCRVGHAYEVTEAGNGEEALRAIETGEAPELLITDLIMPKMDGFQLVDRLKNSDRFSAMPYIVMASKGSDDDATRKWLEARPFPHILVQPVNNFQLWDMVDRVAEPLRPLPPLNPDTRLARIVMFDSYQPEIINRVAEYLGVRGHDVVVPRSASALHTALDEKLPDVFVMPMLDLGTDMIRVLYDLRARDGGERLGFIFITPQAPTGGASRHWSMPIDSYVTRPYTNWQLLVSIEQLIYRHVVADDGDIRASKAFTSLPRCFAEEDALGAMKEPAAEQNPGPKNVKPSPELPGFYSLTTKRTSCA
jgi:CheY-like chemotaxis protein